MSRTPRFASFVARLGAVGLVVAAAALGCRKPAAPPAKADPLAPAASIGSIALPASSLGDAPTDATRIYATKSALYVGDDRIGDGPRPEEGYNAKDRRTSLSLEITEISRRLKGKDDVLVYADAELPGAALTQIVYSAQVAGAKRISLMTKGDAGVRALPLELSSPKRRCPHLSPPPPPPAGSASAPSPPLPAPPPPMGDCDPGLALGLLVTADGIVVLAHGMRMGEACTQPGPGLSVTGYDAARLRACIATSRIGVPASPTDKTVTVAPAAGAKIGDLVRVMDAMRSGDAPFTAIRLGVM
jgi:hypothetical protein